MLTVKFYTNGHGNDMNVFECDQVQSSVFQVDPYIRSVTMWRDGKQIGSINVEESNAYAWAIAYVENAAGKTIEVIRPPVVPVLIPA